MFIHKRDSSHLGYDSDASQGTSFTAFDPINLAFAFADHSIGNNLATNNDGVEAKDETGYTSLIAENNVAQNSWKPHWL